MNLQSKKILITGGAGFLGRNLYDALIAHGISKDNIKSIGHETDLRDKATCESAFDGVDVVFHLAANTGGINKHMKIPGAVIYDNLLMNANVLEAARNHGTEKLVLLGTACSYPANAPMPLNEKDLWIGYPAKETAYYGLVKLMMQQQAQAYKQQYGVKSAYIIPPNLYGKYDKFGEEAHVIPSLIRKFVHAASNKLPEVAIWGNGNASREFLFADDACNAIILAAEKYDSPEPMNIGVGKETPIKEIVSIISNVVGYEGQIKWDTNMPNGAERRVMDITMAEKELGVIAKTDLLKGIKETVYWYKQNILPKE